MKKVLLIHLTVASLVLLSYVFFVIKPLSAPMTDLAVYMEAGQRMANGEDIYEHIYNQDIRQRIQLSGAKDVPEWYRMHYFYPPFLAAVSSPWAGLSHNQAKLLWSNMNFIFLLLSLLIITALLDNSSLNRISPAARFSTLLFLSVGFDPFIASFAEGQIDIPVLFLLSLCALCLSRKSFPLAGASCSLAFLAKLSPAIFCLNFLIYRRWSAIVAFALTAIAAVSMLLFSPIPFASYSAFFEKFSILAAGSLETSLALNMSAAKFFLLPGALWKITWLQSLVRIFILAGFGLLLGKLARGESKNELDSLSLLVILMILLSPTTWAHHLVWLFLCLVLLAKRVQSIDSIKDWVAIGVVYVVLARAYSIQSLVFLSSERLLPIAHGVVIACLCCLIYFIAKPYYSAK